MRRSARVTVTIASLALLAAGPVAEGLAAPTGKDPAASAAVVSAPAALPPMSRAVASVVARSDAWIEAHADTLRAVNRRIWAHPEVGLAEHRSSAELATLLEREGFQVQRSVAGMPTAFVATAGTGRPIVGFLAEYDALPGMNQAAAAERGPRTHGSDSDAGHACGHSIFGTASAAAGIAAWSAWREGGRTGTVRVYGTPAEETAIGKVYMARAGLFDDLDAAFHWHAHDATEVLYSSTKAAISLKFTFEGRASHASMAPEAGRSALDGVELMNVGANFLREHLREDARIHYVVTDGGGQPNVVPPHAQVWYYVRANRHADAEAILGRLRDIAQGASLMSGTTVQEAVQSDCFEILPNQPLSALLQRQLERVGPPRFDDAERDFARRTQADLPQRPADPLATEIRPLAQAVIEKKNSTDVGNVSWAVPTGGIDVACYTKGAPGHSWQIVACTGMTIGEKGMAVAARTLAGAALELLATPALVDAARRDFEARRAASPVPTSVLPVGQAAPTKIR